MSKTINDNDHIILIMQFCLDIILTELAKRAVVFMHRKKSLKKKV